MAKKLVYELWPIAWPKGLTQMEIHLKRIAKLGADYVWLAPVYPSPRKDHGYDISDFRAIDPRIGTLDDFKRFVRTAHGHGLKVLMDMVLHCTSTEHPWFKENPEYYCFEPVKEVHDGWENLFAPGERPFAYSKQHDMYYLHLFTEGQADLNWFPYGTDGSISDALADEFRETAQFWLDLGVDGFRLDAVQALNKDLDSDTMNLSTLLKGERALTVIENVFDGLLTTKGEKPFLMAEVFDPWFGDLANDYANVGVDFVMNMLIKQELDVGKHDNMAELMTTIESAVLHPSVMLDLENHDSPRVLSRIERNPIFRNYHPKHAERILLFGTNANAICIYQGQELGTYNPDHQALPGEDLITLDAQTEMRWKNGEKLADLRPLSRANARVPINIAEYRHQEETHHSFLKNFIKSIRVWKNS